MIVKGLARGMLWAFTLMRKTRLRHQNEKKFPPF